VRAVFTKTARVKRAVAPVILIVVFVLEIESELVAAEGEQGVPDRYTQAQGSQM
jgi:hypothetical protein